jgi:ParB-like chromosome segregation protein Spo0J
MKQIQEAVAQLMALLADLPADERIEALNYVRYKLHGVSPLKDEPVDCVLWIDADAVEGNSYNPNCVSPPELRLLEHSVREDGYTQPIVAWRRGDSYEIVDGFHRNRVGREIPDIKERIRGYLPLTIINQDREDKTDRIAATIRHNRARGKHQVDAMSDIVQELSRRNWSDAKIGRELGMDPDEVLRLKQITGLAELFTQQDFSEAWEPELDL